MCWIYFVKQKFEVCDVFIKFYKMILTQFQKEIWILRTNNGGEYINQKLQTFFPTVDLFTKPHVLSPLNKMGLQRGKTEHFLIKLDPL